MARLIELNINNRDLTTNGDVKKLRRDGVIPCIVYGKGFSPINSMVNKKEYMTLLLHSLDEHVIFNISVDGGKEKYIAIMKERQWDPIKQEITHIDFLTIDLTEEIDLYSEFKFIGIPKGVKQGGIIETRHTKVKGKCLPMDYPKYLECDISNLGIGDVLRMKDIAKPETLNVQYSPEEIILTVAVPKKARGEAVQSEAAKEPVKVVAKQSEDKKNDKK